MTHFSQKQTRALRRKLDRSRVQSREVEGRSIDYIEGWFAIAEANAIFGFRGWDRETTHCERLFERTRSDSTSCGYVARVRIRVRAGDAIILREGTGWGSATAPHTGDAHERAIKAAETDATKRALATFGNRFGLGLYDKEQAGVTARKPSTVGAFTLYDPSGAPFAENLSPESFCSALRQLAEAIHEPSELEGLERFNRDGITRLRTDAPQLKTARDVHYADILGRLIKERLKSSRAAPPANGHGIPLPSLVPLKPSRIAIGPRIDKSMLSIGMERRLRDKAHLQYVASHPCLVCGRQPCQAHHLTFTQKRGLSLKVSDEFAVPLCAVHHDELHRSPPERSWWATQGIDPEPIATDLWTKSRANELPPEAQSDGLASPPEIRSAPNASADMSNEQIGVLALARARRNPMWYSPTEDPRRRARALALVRLTSLLRRIENNDSARGRDAAMSSQRKIDANRANAVKSTGPKSVNGGALSRLNALKTGIYAAASPLPGEDVSAHRQVIADIHDLLKPKGPIEEMLADQIGGDLMRIKRLERAERAYFQEVRDTRLNRMIQSCSGAEFKLLEKIMDQGFLAMHPRKLKDDFVGQWLTQVQMELDAKDGQVPPSQVAPEPEPGLAEAVQAKLDHAQDIDGTLLEGIVVKEERQPKEQLDRQRRALVRDVLRNFAAIEALQQRRMTVDNRAREKDPGSDNAVEK